MELYSHLIMSLGKSWPASGGETTVSYPVGLSLTFQGSANALTMTHCIFESS